MKIKKFIKMLNGYKDIIGNNAVTINGKKITKDNFEIITKDMSLNLVDKSNVTGASGFDFIEEEIINFITFEDSRTNINVLLPIFKIVRNIQFNEYDYDVYPENSSDMTLCLTFISRFDTKTQADILNTLAEHNEKWKSYRTYWDVIMDFYNQMPKSFKEFDSALTAIANKSYCC